MIVGTVESVKLLEHISSGLDYCEIAIDFDLLKIFGSYNEIMSYIGKQVQYDIRKDMYNGEQIDVIANIVDSYVVQTLQEEDNIKLIPEETETRAVCNFSIDSLKFGDYDSDCIAYLSGCEKGSSKKTTWIDCKMVDKKSKVFDLRIFTKNIENGIDADETLTSWVGHYVKFDITNTKYGYQTSDIELYNVPVVAPPEVDIAISQIKKVVAGDSELLDYMTTYNFIDTLKNVIDNEPGYHLVAIASEIYLINAIKNISNVYDTKVLIRAAITSRGYLLPSKTKFSRVLLNTNKVMRSALGKDRELMLILDPTAEEESSPTKKVYIDIANFARKILNERRGIEDEIENDYSVSALRHMFGGLL